MKFRKVIELLSNIKWIIRSFNITLMRRKLEKSTFYDEVVFANDTVKKWVQKNVALWMFNLRRYKGIEIKQFRDLFINLDEVSFPIQIKEAFISYLDIDLIDSCGNKYYMLAKDANEYYKMKKYYIGKRNNPSEPLVDKSYCYEIGKDGSNKLIKTSILKLKQDESNSDTMCEISFNKNTVITIYSQKNKITVEYPKRDDKLDEEVIKYLFECSETKWYYYDVFPIIKWLVGKMGRDVSANIISEIDEHVFSTIKVENDIVTEYTVTQIISEEEMHVIKKVFAKELKKFLKDDTEM